MQNDKEGQTFVDLIYVGPSQNTSVYGSSVAGRFQAILRNNRAAQAEIFSNWLTVLQSICPLSSDVQPCRKTIDTAHTIFMTCFVATGDSARAAQLALRPQLDIQALFEVDRDAET